MRIALVTAGPRPSRRLGRDRCRVPHPRRSLNRDDGSSGLGDEAVSIPPACLVPVWLLAAVLLAPACSGKRSSLVIRVDGPTTTILGPYDPIRHPTLAGATHAFGQPSKCEYDQTVWKRVGLRLAFGGPANSRSCSSRGRQPLSEGGYAHLFGRWRTPVGLAVGDSVARLRKLYPQSTLRQYDGAGGAVTGWLLVTRAYRDPDRHRFPALVARTERGRVTGFVVPLHPWSRHAPIGQPLAPQANARERSAIRRSRSLPQSVRRASVECLSIYLRMSLNHQYAIGGIALRLGGNCHGHLANGYTIFRRNSGTGAWTTVYEGSDWPPCSLRIPLELHSCLMGRGGRAS
jgi:hypothetical protein